jgi:hypothetical protein
MLMRLKPTNKPQMPPKLPENRGEKRNSERMKTAAALRAQNWPNFKHLTNRIISCVSYNIVSVFKTSLIDDLNVNTPPAARDSVQYLANYRRDPQA